MATVVGVGVGDVHIGLLDGVELVVRDSGVPLRGERERALLARLALDVGREVTRDVLLHDVWGSERGSSGSGALRVQVKRLRDLLASHDADACLETTPGGYRLVADVSVDAVDLADAVADGSADPARPACGSPLRGLEDLEFARIAASKLTRLCHEASVSAARALLAAGRADAAESRLAAVATASPTDEGVAVLRMDALVALGRSRDALNVAHAVRRELAQVGLVPGADVLRREQEILNPGVPPAGGGEPAVTGRRVEIDRLVDRLEALADGVGTTITITGPAGIGKTALAEIVVDEALRRGVAVVTASADEMEQARPFHLLHWADLRRPGEAPHRLDMTGVLADVPDPGDPGGFDPAGARLSVATRVNELIAERDGPVVVLAEDLHWADESSLAVLRSLCRAARQRALLVVLTGRPAPDWQASLGELPRLSIELGPLGAAESLALAGGYVGGSLGPELADAVAAAGGHPLLVIEYLRGLELEGRLVRIGDVVDSAGSGSPTTVQALAAHRLRALPDETVVALETAAVIGRTCDADLLDRMIDVDGIAALLRPAEAAGIVSFDGLTVRYQHDLLRDGVYDGIEVARRRAMHREVASLLAASGRPVISVAAHAALGGAEHDDQAVAWMRDAAAEACAVEPRSSVAFLDRALSLTRSIDERFVLQHAKVEALTTAGDLREATELVDVLVQARRPETAVLQVRYAGLLMAQAKANEARSVLAGVEVDALSDELRARWGALTALCSYAAFDQAAARAHAVEAIEVGGRAGDAIGLSMAHGVIGRCDLMQHHYEAGLRAGKLAGEYADADPTGGGHLYLPWYFVGMTELDLDRHDAVEVSLERGRDASSRHHLHFSRPLYLTLETALAQRAGDLERAHRAGVEVLEIEQQLGYTLVSAWVRALLSLAALEGGDPALAETYCQAAEAAQAAGSPQGAHMVALARAELLRLAGDTTAVLNGLRENWEFFDAFSLHACKPWIAPALTRAAVECGDDDTARGVASEMAVLSERSDAVAHRAAQSWVEGLIGDDVQLLRMASAGYRSVGRERDAALVESDAARVTG